MNHAADSARRASPASVIIGNQRLDADYLRARIRRGLGKPVDINQLNDNLRLLLLERKRSINPVVPLA